MLLSRSLLPWQQQAYLEMEVDTGASASIIWYYTYKELWRGCLPPLKKTNVKLRTYSGEIIKVLGTMTIEVVYEHQKEQLPLLVVVGNGPSLLGKDWMKKIRLNWNKLVHKVEEEEHTLAGSCYCKTSQCFQLGLVKSYLAKIHVDPTSSPRFCKARPVVYALRGKSMPNLTDCRRKASSSLWSFLNGLHPLFLWSSPMDLFVYVATTKWQSTQHRS